MGIKNELSICVMCKELKNLPVGRVTCGSMCAKKYRLLNTIEKRELLYK